MTKSPALAEHVCRFNDGENVCTCFMEGWKAGEKDNTGLCAAACQEALELRAKMQRMEIENTRLRSVLEVAVKRLEEIREMNCIQHMPSCSDKAIIALKEISQLSHAPKE